jgi:hypothetical protein
METVVLGAILACGNDRVVRIDNLPHEIRAVAPEGPSRPEPPSPLAMDDNTIVPLSELERRAIARSVWRYVTRAARALGINARRCRKLTAQDGGRVVLLGRRPLPPPSPWLTGVAPP